MTRRGTAVAGACAPTRGSGGAPREVLRCGERGAGRTGLVRGFAGRVGQAAGVAVRFPGLVALIWFGVLRAGAQSEMPAGELVAQGRFVFEQNCMLCHGRRGNGRGEFAATTLPRPRDFTRGLFKYRSTPSGFLPTDEDLRRTIRSGLAGTAMPAFTLLPEGDLRAVIAFVKSLSPRWADARHRSPPLDLPAKPAWLGDREGGASHAARGREVFGKACAACHGAGAAGDGPSAAALQDEWEEPCPPRDLRLAMLRAGASAEALYRTLTTGLDGTPMPSFAEALTAEERWEIVAYLLELRGPW